MSQERDKVRMVEVGPRDGLQNHTGLIVPTEVKVEFIKRLAAAGHTHIEVGAFGVTRERLFEARHDVVGAMQVDEGLAPLRRVQHLS